jgi:hypothetical protein
MNPQLSHAEFVCALLITSYAGLIGAMVVIAYVAARSA